MRFIQIGLKENYVQWIVVTYLVIENWKEIGRKYPMRIRRANLTS